MHWSFRVEMQPWRVCCQWFSGSTEASCAGRSSSKESGFFLALTTVLSDEQQFASLASLLKDKRLRGSRYFFHGVESPRAKQLAKLKTPVIAQEWGFLMNMGLDSFRSTFDTFAVP
jgi:hypothetical protein